MNKIYLLVALLIPHFIEAAAKKVTFAEEKRPRAKQQQLLRCERAI